MAPHETVLLSPGDHIDIRNVGSLYIVQPNVLAADVSAAIGGQILSDKVEEDFVLYNRIVGEGGQSRVILGTKC